MSYLTDIDYPTIALLTLIWLLVAFFVTPKAIESRAATGMYSAAIEAQTPLLKAIITEQFNEFLQAARAEAEGMQAQQVQAYEAAELSAEMSVKGTEGQTKKQIADANLELVKTMLGPLSEWAFEYFPTLETLSRRSPEGAMQLVSTGSRLLGIDITDPESVAKLVMGGGSAGSKPGTAATPASSGAVRNPYG